MLSCALQFLRSFQKSRSAPVSASVIVAHPDDETLWAGGEILSHPEWEWYILSLTRASDPDRAPQFWRAIDRFNGTGHIDDLDDGPDQEPLPIDEVKRAILSGLPPTEYDLVITHAPTGEYTRHLRHEEVSRAMIELWRSGGISAKSLMMFAYEDGQRAYLPRACQDAHIKKTLCDSLWQSKHKIITDIYGFAAESWEARTTPRQEAFWQFDSPQALADWLKAEESNDENPCTL